MAQDGTPSPQDGRGLPTEQAPEQGLAEVADRLYALPPEEFTAARDAAAKAQPALKATVKALRRPTASAHLVNRLAREQPDLLEKLLSLGPALAQAQADGSGDALRELGRQRRELVEAVTGTATGDAEVGSSVRAEVAQTLEAALADPAAAGAVRSGTLVRALSFAGFGGVDLDGAVAVTTARTGAGSGKGTSGRAREPDGKGREDGHGSSPARTAGGGRSRTLAAAEQRALDAAAALDDAVRACEQAQQRADDGSHVRQEAQSARDAAAAEVEALERRLADARQGLEELGHRAHDATAEERRAAAAAERARHRVAEAQDAAEQARKALDALRRA